MLRVRGTDPKTTEDANTVNLIGQELQELKEGINEFQSKAFEALYEKKVQWEPEASSVPTSEATVEAAAATDAFTTKTESDVKDSTAELGTSDMTTPAVIVADIPPVEVKAIEKVVAIEPVEEGPKVVVGKKRKAGVPNKPAMGFAPVVKPVAVETQIKEKEVEVKIGKVVEAVKVDKEEVKPVLDTKPSVAKVEPMLSKIQLTPGSKVSDEFDSSELVRLFLRYFPFYVFNY